MPTNPPETTPPPSRRAVSLRSVTALEPLSIPVFRLLWSTWLTANLCMWMTGILSGSRAVTERSDTALRDGSGVVSGGVVDMGAVGFRPSLESAVHATR